MNSDKVRKNQTWKKKQNKTPWPHFYINQPHDAIIYKKDQTALLTTIRQVSSVTVSTKNFFDLKKPKMCRSLSFILFLCFFGSLLAEEHVEEEQESTGLSNLHLPSKYN